MNNNVELECCQLSDKIIDIVNASSISSRLDGFQSLVEDLVKENNRLTKYNIQLNERLEACTKKVDQMIALQNMEAVKESIYKQDIESRVTFIEKMKRPFADLVKEWNSWAKRQSEEGREDKRRRVDEIDDF